MTRRESNLRDCFFSGREYADQNNNWSILIPGAIKNHDASIEISAADFSMVFGLTIGWIGLNNSFAALGIITFIIAAFLLLGAVKKS